MTALVCDICGGKLSMGSGGIAICESCGMEHTKDRMQEKIQEIKGTVRIDNSHMVENYRSLLKTSLLADDWEKSDSYCDKILEVEPSDYRIWLEKAKLNTLHSREGYSNFPSFAQMVLAAFEHSSLEERQAAAEESADFLLRFAKAQMNVWIYYQADHNKANSFENIVNSSCILFEGMLKNIRDNGLDEGPLLAKYIKSKNIYVENITNCVHSKWGIVSLIPDWATMVPFFAKECIQIGRVASEMTDIDEKIKSDFFNEILTTMTEIVKFGTQFRDFPQSEIKEYYLEAFEYVTLLKEEAINNYWENHQEEKSSLEQEMQDLLKLCETCKSEISSLEKDPGTSIIEMAINDLVREKSSLGLFKVKEKENIQKQIDMKIMEKIDQRTKNDSAIQELNKRLVSIEQRLSSIRTELTMER